MSIKETIEALRAEASQIKAFMSGGGERYANGMIRSLDVLVPEIALLEAERDAAFDAVTIAVEDRDATLCAARDALSEDIRIAADGDLVAGVKGLEAAYQVERKAVEDHARELAEMRQVNAELRERLEASEVEVRSLRTYDRAGLL